MIYCEEDVVPRGGRPPFIPPGLPIGASAATSLGIYLYYGIIDR